MPEAVRFQSVVIPSFFFQYSGRAAAPVLFSAYHSSKMDAMRQNFFGVFHHFICRIKKTAGLCSQPPLVLWVCV